MVGVNAETGAETVTVGRPLLVGCERCRPLGGEPPALMSKVRMSALPACLGATVTFDDGNDAPMPHNLKRVQRGWRIVRATDDLSSGGAEAITAELNPKEYTMFCSLAPLGSLGVSGMLTLAAL